MIHSFKNREVNFDKRVKIFRNLNKKGVWYSIQQNGLTVGYVSDITLKDVKFIVREKTRQRIVITKERAVHAFIDGFIVLDNIALDFTYTSTVRYNPFKYNSFVSIENDLAKVVAADFVRCCESGVTAWCTTLG